MTKLVLDWQRVYRQPPPVHRLCKVALSLPQLHGAILAKRRCPVTTAREVVEEARKVIGSRLDLDDEAAYFLWQAHGFAIAFGERHLQAVGRAPGAAVALLGDHGSAWITSMMLKVGAPAPRLTVDYWLGNLPAEHSPTFTGSPGEYEFRTQVWNVSETTQHIASVLGDLVDGSLLIEDSELQLLGCTERAREMMQGMQRLTRLFDRETAEFSTGMRQYLTSYSVCPVKPVCVEGGVSYDCAYPIDGRVWAGPNAANIPGVPLMDLKLGIADLSYREMVFKRMEWYGSEDRASIAAALGEERTLEDVLAVALGVRKVEMLKWSAKELAGALGGITPRLKASIWALSRLCVTLRQWNGGHMGSIKAHVIDAAQRIPACDVKKYPVAFSVGVSGDGLDHAKHIYMLRKGAYLHTVLEQAVRIATPAANDTAISRNAEG